MKIDISQQNKSSAEPICQSDRGCVCARVVSERIRNRSANIGRAAAPQVELRSTLTGTRCPNRSPAVTDNTPTERRREREEREMEETGESMKMEEGWRKYGNEI